MATTVTGLFETRRDAELAVERMVQEHGIERTDIFIETETAENSAGAEIDGADAESGHPGVDKEADPALNGRIKVSADLEDDAAADKVRAAMAELGGEISEG